MHSKDKKSKEQKFCPDGRGHAQMGDDHGVGYCSNVGTVNPTGKKLPMTLKEAQNFNGKKK